MFEDEFASFIIARDPSLLPWNRPPIRAAIRMEFSDGSSSSSCSKSDVLEDDNERENLEVFLRIKPAPNIHDLYEYTENIFTCKVPNGYLVQDGNNKVTKEYTFSKIYGPEVNQTKLFNCSVKRKVLGFINGRNSTIFTYGTSGSGKTFTILGTPEEPGIIPRSLEYLFRTIPSVEEPPKSKPSQSGEVKVLTNSECSQELKVRNKLLNSSPTAVDKQYGHTYKMMQKRLTAEPIAILAESTDVSVSIWVSFAEVYNECVYDLLISPPGRGNQRPKLRLCQDKKGNTFIRSLTNVSVCSGLQAYEILQYGMHNLNYAATSMNSHSSRSHCIFTIKLVQVSPNSKAQISYFNFCDLAGSERVKNTNNVGERLKESNNINTSLHVLGRCIKSIRESQKNNDTKLVPFRESKLTRLFQRALTGHESIAMVVNINPSRHMFDESQHVLNFSAIAKDITIEKKKDKPAANKRFSQYIQGRSTALPITNEPEQNEIEYLQEQVLNLTMELEQQRLLFAEKEMQIRREIVDAFQHRKKEMLHNWNLRMEETKQGIIDSYNVRIQGIINYYKNEQNRARMNSTVIDLDTSSCDNENDDLKMELKAKNHEIEQILNNLNEYQKMNSELQAEKTQLEFQLSMQNSIAEDLKIKMQQMSLDMIHLKNKNLEYEEIINAAEIEFKETTNEIKNLELKLNEKVIETMQLKEEVQNLERVSMYYSKRAEQMEESLNNENENENNDE